MFLNQNDNNHNDYNNNNNNLNTNNNHANITQFKIENIYKYKILENNDEMITCIKILDDGRLTASDSKSNLIIYNKETFNPDIIINNNLNFLYNFTQLKNKNIICSFFFHNTLKIIKLKDNNNYENIQIIENAHDEEITKIIELKNENLITFSWDHSFKVWKLNKNNNDYVKIFVFKESNEISDALLINDREILYDIYTIKPSLIFYDVDKCEKITTLNNFDLNIINIGNRITKLNNNEVAVAGNKKVYLIDIYNYQILHEINCNNKNYCILKLSSNFFLTGDENGTITQYKIENKKLNKESSKNNIYEYSIVSLAIINDIIISGGDSHMIII